VTTPALAEHVKGKGRMYRHPVTDVLVPSITNVIGTLDKPALPRWSAKMVAETAYRMRHALPNMEQGEAVDMLKSAPFSKASRAADRGTDIHAYLESRLNGYVPDDLSDDAVPYRQAADEWLEFYQPEMVATELSVFGAGFAGTGDLWCMMGDRLTIVDFKTSKAVYDEAALQLSALWGATVTGEGEPAPHVRSGLPMLDVDLLVVRIGTDKYEVKQVAEPERSFNAFLSLLTAWEWKHTKAYL
jgi:hypothetical protein